MEIYNRPFIQTTVSDNCSICDGYGSLKKSVLIQIDDKPWRTKTCQVCNGSGNILSQEETVEATNSEWLSLLQDQVDTMSKERGGNNGTRTK